MEILLIDRQPYKKRKALKAYAAHTILVDNYLNYTFLFNYVLNIHYYYHYYYEQLFKLYTICI